MRYILLRQFVGYEEEDNWLQQPHVMVIHHANHYFVAVFDYVRQRVNVYCRYYDMCNRYDGGKATWELGEDSWKGRTIYNSLKAALSNQLPDTPPACQTVNWFQVHQ